MASARYSSSSWHLDAKLLENIQKWEQLTLRRLLGLHRRRPGEDNKAYWQRLTATIREVFWKSGCYMAHHRLLWGLPQSGLDLGP